MNKLVYIGPLIFVLIWFLLSELELVSALLVPSPVKVIAALPELFSEENILADALATLARMVTGYFLATIVGIPVGLIIGFWKKLYHSVEFLLDFFRSLPSTALFPMFLLFFGIGDSAKIAVVMFACTLIIIVNTTYGVKSINPTRIMVAKLMKASRFQIFSKVIFQESLPHIAAGLRIALSTSLILVIVTEMFIGTRTGLGQKIFDLHLTYQIPEMYGAIIIAGTIGYVLNKAFLIFEARVIHWTGK